MFLSLFPSISVKWQPIIFHFQTHKLTKVPQNLFVQHHFSLTTPGSETGSERSACSLEIKAWLFPLAASSSNNLFFKLVNLFIRDSFSSCREALSSWRPSIRYFWPALFMLSNKTPPIKSRWIKLCFLCMACSMNPRVFWFLLAKEGSISDVEHSRSLQFQRLNDCKYFSQIFREAAKEIIRNGKLRSIFP